MALNYVLLPNDVYGVTFGSCTAGDVVIPSTYNNKPVAYIDFQAFLNCTSITSLSIPSSIVGIDIRTFSSTSALMSINVDESNQSFASLDGVLFNKNLTNLLCYPRARTGHYTIPNSVTTIGSLAFWTCAIESVTIPSSVTTIGDAAFTSCASLASVSIPSSVTIIPKGSFQNCTSLANVSLPNSVTTIDSNAFQNCTSLANINIPNSVTRIGPLAFYDCTSLLDVTIPSSIGITVGNRAFANCSSLTTANTGNSLSTIDGETFRDCTSLTSVIIGPSVTFIGQGSFQGCTSLNSVIMGNLVQRIATLAFENCTSLESISFPDSLTNIGDAAFSLCQSLISITISRYVIFIGRSAFYRCTSLTNITIDPLNANYASLDGVFFNKNLTSLFTYPPNKAGSSYHVPNSVTNIEISAFVDSDKLTDIILGDNVKIIEPAAFANCSSLLNIKLGNSIETIKGGAFGGCSSLRSITLPASLKNLGIGSRSGVFYSCTSLTRLNFLGNFPSLSQDAFRNISPNLKIYRKKNFVTGLPSSAQGVPVVLWSDNVIKSGGAGKLIARSFDRDALKYIKSIESVTSPSYPITEDGKNKIDNFIKQIKQIIPWNSFVAWTFVWGQNANQTGFTDDKYNGIIKSFGGLGEGIVTSANTSTFFASDGMSFSSPGGLLVISPSTFFTEIKSIFGVLYPTTNTYFGNLINQSILSIAGGSGPSIKSYGNLYYRNQGIYSKITRNSIDDIQTNGASVWTSLNKYRSLGTVFDTNSTSNYSNGIKQFTTSSLLSPNASDFNGVTIGGGIPIGKIPFVFASNLVLTENQMLQLHNIYKNTLGKDLPNSQL